MSQFKKFLLDSMISFHFTKEKKINVAVSIEIKTLILTICQLYTLCYIFFWMISKYFYFKNPLI